MNRLFIFCVSTLLLVGSGLVSNAQVSPSSTTLCLGSTVTMADTLSGGFWLSSAPAIATIDSVTGVANLVGTGTVMISYTNGTETDVFTIVSEGTLDPGTISGGSTVCAGATLVLNETALGGTWHSTDTMVATIATGNVSGLVAGTDSIIYSLSNSCGTFSTSLIITVNATPGPISVASAFCVGTTISATDTAGGLWASAYGLFTVDGSGTLTGLSAGSDVLSYTLSDGCFATTTVEIDIPASAILSDSTVCQRSVLSLADSALGGTWASADSSILFVSGSHALGVNGGMTTLYYTLTNSCGTYADSEHIHVLAAPPSLVYSTNMCVGGSQVVTDSVAGGTWAVLNANLSIDSLGMIHALAMGSDLIDYTISDGCSALGMVLIDTIPAMLTGDSAVCNGSYFSLSDGIADGSWAIADTNIVAMDYTSGGNAYLTGVMPGSTTISYTNGCGTATKSVAVFAPPVAGTITGAATVCQGAQLTLTDASGGGVWSSRYDTVATCLGNIYTGAGGGIGIAVYAVSNVCGSDSTTYSFTVNALPTAGMITGTDTFCVGAVVTLTDTTYMYASTYLWHLSNNRVVNISGDEFEGIAAGLDTLTYVVSNSCGADSVTVVKYVKPLPLIGPIMGPDSLCPGTSIVLTDGIGGGTWVSLDTTVATMMFGLVTGFNSGTTVIKYSISNSCGASSVSLVVTVNPLPDAGVLFFTDSLCPGTGSVVTETNPGGTLGSYGLVAFSGDSVIALTPGIDSVIYTYTNMCGTASVANPIYVYPSPNAGSIVAPDSICIGSMATISDSVSGGIWSTATSLATISGNILTGDLTGVDTIYYTMTQCGTAVASHTVTVLKVPNVAPILGTTTVCVGDSTMLSDSTSGGAWSVANGNASVFGGKVKGLVAGNDIVTYTVSNMCGSWPETDSIRVITIPVVSVSAGTAICVNDSETLTGTPAGGSWSASNGSGVVSGLYLKGVFAGKDTLTYVASNSCGLASGTAVVSIDTFKYPIVSGGSQFCVTKSDTLTVSISGGVWSVSDSSLFSTSDVAAGIFQSVASGRDTIFYSLTEVCGIVRDTLAVQVFSAWQCDSINSVRSVADPGSVVMEVYPNPSNGTFSVSLRNSGSEEAELEVIDAAGRVIYDNRVMAVHEVLDATVGINGLPGVYLVRLVTAEGQKYTRTLLLSNK